MNTSASEPSTEPRAFRVVIPARYGSQRLPGKPLVEIAGRPLIHYVYERACESGAEAVVVATDDARIARCAEGFGAEVCLTGAHHASGTDRLGEAVLLLGWGEQAIVVNVQGDEPLIPPANIRQVAANLAAQPQAGMATLCTPIAESGQWRDPNIVKVVRDAGQLALYFSRAAIPWRSASADPSEAPALAYRHIGLYAYRLPVLLRLAETAPAPLESLERLEQLRALSLGIRIHCGLAAGEPGPGVDALDDLAIVERWLKCHEQDS